MGEQIETDTKTHQARSIALDVVAVEVLNRRWDFQRWYAESAEAALVADPYVLSSHPTGDEPLAREGLSHAFTRVNRRVGLDCHLHELRHCTATTAIAAAPTSGPCPDGWVTPDPSVTLGSMHTPSRPATMRWPPSWGRRCGLN